MRAPPIDIKQKGVRQAPKARAQSQPSRRISEKKFSEGVSFEPEYLKSSPRKLPEPV